MIVYRYRYDETIGKNIFRDEYRCQEDPEEQGSYLQPKNSTIEIPELKEGFIAYWEDDQWKYMEDYRNKKFYEKSSGIENLNPNFTNLSELIDEKPTYIYSKYNEDSKRWVIDYVSIIDAFKNNLDDIIEKYTKDNLSISLSDKNIIVNYNEESIKSVERLINYLSTSDVKNVEFKTYDNNIVPLNKKELTTIYNEMMKYNQELINKKWEIKKYIEKINSENDVINFAKLYNVNIYKED